MIYVKNPEIRVLMAEGLARTTLESRLPKLQYHCPDHSLVDTLGAARKYAKVAGLSSHDSELLFVAAMLHDSGYTERYKANEPIGVRIAENIMIKLGYPESDIEIVRGLIRATAMPQRPSTYLQKIMCDCDLDSLGTSNFFDRGSRLRKEWESWLGLRYTDKEWWISQFSFLNGHQFFTQAAVILGRTKGQLNNLLIVERKLRDLEC